MRAYLKRFGHDLWEVVSLTPIALAAVVVTAGWMTMIVGIYLVSPWGADDLVKVQRIVAAWEQGK